MTTHNIYAYVDTFPQYKVFHGRKCLIFGNFQKHNNFVSLTNRTIDYDITCLSTNQKITETFRASILNFGTWMHGEPEFYGVILPEDIELEKGTVVSISAIVPDLGGV